MKKRTKSNCREEKKSGFLILANKITRQLIEEPARAYLIEAIH